MNAILAKIALDASKVSFSSAAHLLKIYGPQACARAEVLRAQAEILKALAKVAAPISVIVATGVTTIIVKAADKKNLRFFAKFFVSEVRFEAHDDPK